MPRINRTSEQAEQSRGQGSAHLELLARGLRIITLFNAQHREMTLAELSALSDTPRSSVRRVMATLQSLGMAELNDRHYRLTPRILMLAAAYLRSNTLTDRLQPLVDDIALRAGHSCSAAVLDGNEAVMIARAVPRRIITAALTIGFRLPAYASSVGRVLLGGLSPEALDAYFDALMPERLTDRTVTDKAKLRALIAEDVARGYSFVDQEAEADFRSVAVPVHGPDGSVLCALHVGLSSGQSTQDQILAELLPVLRDAAQKAETVLSV